MGDRKIVFALFFHFLCRASVRTLCERTTVQRGVQCVRAKRNETRKKNKMNCVRSAHGLKCRSINFALDLLCLACSGYFSATFINPWCVFRVQNNNRTWLTRPRPTKNGETKHTRQKKKYCVLCCCPSFVVYLWTRERSHRTPHIVRWPIPSFGPVHIRRIDAFVRMRTNETMWTVAPHGPHSFRLLFEIADTWFLLCDCTGALNALLIALSSNFVLQ